MVTKRKQRTYNKLYYVVRRAEVLITRRDYYCNHRDNLRAESVARYYTHHESKKVRARAANPEPKKAATRVTARIEQVIKLIPNLKKLPLEMLQELATKSILS